MPYLSIEHTLLTTNGYPCCFDRELSAHISDPIDDNPIPWAPDWGVLRRVDSFDLPFSRSDGVAWLPRLLWPGDIAHSYEHEVLMDKLHGRPYTVWAFGDGSALADELLELVGYGKKRATCGSLAAYEEEDEPVPEAGDLSVVTDGKGIPRALIRTTESTVRLFGEVDEQFAYDEGEGDRSYRFWREAHERFFRRESEAAGRPFTDDFPVVCERFELIERFGEE